MKKMFLSIRIVNGGTDNSQSRLLFEKNIRDGEFMDQEIKIASYKFYGLPTKTLKQKIDNWHNDRFMYSFIVRANNQGTKLLKFICKGEKIYG